MTTPPSPLPSSGLLWDTERSKVTLRHWYSVIPALPVEHYGGHSIKQHLEAKEGSLSQDHNWNKCEKVAGNAFRHHVFMEPKPRPQRAYALFFPSPFLFFPSSS